MNEKAAGATAEPQVGLIDMQWCGKGIGAVDVVYCIAASADPSQIPVFGSAAAVTEAVQFVQSLAYEYHCALLDAFVLYGVASDAHAASAVLPADVFREQFEWAWIDLSRCCVGDHWGTITKEIISARRGKMAFNAYNKSEAVATLVATVTDEYLRRHEHRQATGETASAQATL